METDFKKLQVWSFPNSFKHEVGEDSDYWKNLQFPVTIKNTGQVTHIEFSPVEPHDYLVTNSTRVTLYSSKTNAPIKTHHRFKDPVHSASFRRDGQLFVLGGDDSKVRVISEKMFERSLEGHKRPVHLTRFISDHRVFSGSDDKTVKLWDVGSSAIIKSYNDHKDYIRCGAAGTDPELFVTGSYDQTVRLFDSRTDKSVMTFNHGDPVESVLMYPTGQIVVSAGSNVVKMWDVAQGGRLMASFSNHHKTITGLCFTDNETRIVSASLDRQVKFYDFASGKITMSLDYPSSLLCLAIAPGDSHIAVGTTDCMLTIRKRMTTEEIDEMHAERRMQRKRKSSGHILATVEDRKPASADVVVEHSKKEYMEKYNKYLRAFKHSKALDEVLRPRIKSSYPELTISVMLELMRRNVLKSALAGRSDKDLSIILSFLNKNFVNPYLSAVCDIMNVVLEVYGEKVWDMPLSLAEMGKLAMATKGQFEYMCDCYEIAGMIKGLLNAKKASGR